MSEWVTESSVSTWGALRPTETVPSGFLCPSAYVIGLRQGSPLRALQSELAIGGRMCHRTSMGPPKPGGLGLNWTLGKPAHFAATTLFPMIPHRGTKLGTLAQRRGMGGRGGRRKTHTHTHSTGSETKGKGTFRTLNTPLPCWAMPDAEAITPPLKRDLKP